jgi:hypothetical protein
MRSPNMGEEKIYIIIMPRKTDIYTCNRKINLIIFLINSTHYYKSLIIEVLAI